MHPSISKTVAIVDVTVDNKVMVGHNEHIKFHLLLSIAKLIKMQMMTLSAEI